MKFDWDENKNKINIRKHRIDFADAVDVFNHTMLILEDTQEDYADLAGLA